jgi:hypothetical protein
MSADSVAIATSSAVIVRRHSSTDSLPEPCKSSRKSCIVIHVNSWERVQATRRLLLILIGVSLIGMAAIVWRSPETLNRISNAIIGQPGNQASVAATQPAEEPPEKPVKKNAKRLRNPVNPPALFADSSQPDILPANLEGGSSQPRRRIIRTGPVQANVKSDSAAVYSSNSPRSPILRMLKKGDRVETNLEVIDSGGRWSLVRPADSNRSGFVRSENLDRAQNGPAETGSER